MLHFKMDMPLFYMALYGSVMIIIVLFLRSLFKNRLPKFVFPIAWCLVLARLLVPFSLSSPLSLPVPSLPGFPGESGNIAFLEETAVQGSYLSDTIPYFEPRDTETPIGTVIEQSVADSGKSDTLITTGMAETAYFSGESRFLGRLSGAFALQLLYIAGAVTAAAAFALQKYRCHQRLSNSFLIEQNETVNSLLREMGMGHVLVFSSDEIASPMVCGFLNPRIFLPTSMDFGNRELLRHIFLHEIMHIRHRDNWVKLALLAALILHWYNPLVWIMSKCLSADLEAFCDAGVLNTFNEEERKKYAGSLLTMAVSGSRTFLLYSAFSRTEVERRIKSVLSYKKATFLALFASIVLLSCGTAVCATGGQAPFSSYLSSFCASDSSRWGAKAELTRDIFLGRDAFARADRVILGVLAKGINDPDVIEAQIKAALAEEFHVETGAFQISLMLTLSEEELAEAYRAWGITKTAEGFYLYQDEPVRIFTDHLCGTYQSRSSGTVDIHVERDKYGEIASLNVWHQGDREYDRH